MPAIEANEKNFDELVDDMEKLVIVDFWAEWCGPCRMLSPIMDQIADEMSDKIKVCKLNIDTETEVARRFGIMSIPTVLIFKEGKLIDKFVGAHPKKSIEEKINSIL